MNLITANNISQHYADKTILDDVSLQLFSNEITTLIGPNGAGKSSLLKILLKLQKPSTGSVTHTKDLTLGFMPQKIHLEPTLPMTVQRFLALGLRKSKLPKNHFVYQVIDDLNLHSILNLPIQSVSGGEMQRILLTRALINKPKLLVLDEPVQGIDIQGQQQLYHYINEIRQRHECGILMVSHDLHVVMKNSDKIICLNQHVRCSGSPETINTNPDYLALLSGVKVDVSQQQDLALYQHHHKSNACQNKHGGK